MSEKTISLGAASNRLHHVSMLYSGAIYELVHGQQVGFIAADHPGLKHTRDLIDLIMFCRAEINALTEVMVSSGLIKREAVMAKMAEEYDFLADRKGTMFGCKFESTGPVWTKGDTQCNESAVQEYANAAEPKSDTMGVSEDYDAGAPIDPDASSAKSV